MTVTNNGAATSSWSLGWTYAGSQKVTNSWNAKVTQSGAAVTAANESYNGTLSTGGSASFGFQGTYSGSNAIPATFTLNGVTCNVDGGTDPTDPPTDPTDPPTDPTGPGDRVDNPYDGAQVYVNPEWSANAAAEPGGDRIADEPTGVWLDRIAAIEGANGGMGLRDHLDAALEQKGSGEMVVQLVIYNLPGRDCSALASNGELGRPRSTATRPSTSTRSPRSSPTRSTRTSGSSPRSRSTRCPTWSPTSPGGRPPRKTAT